AVAAMTGMALVLSYTRTGWVMVVLGALVLGIARYRVLLVLVPLAIAVAVVALPGVHSRVQSVNQQQEVQYGTGDSVHTRGARLLGARGVAAYLPGTSAEIGSEAGKVSSRAWSSWSSSLSGR